MNVKMPALCLGSRVRNFATIAATMRTNKRRRSLSRPVTDHSPEALKSANCTSQQQDNSSEKRALCWHMMHRGGCNDSPITKTLLSLNQLSSTLSSRVWTISPHTPKIINNLACTHN